MKLTLLSGLIFKGYKEQSHVFKSLHWKLAPLKVPLCKISSHKQNCFMYLSRVVSVLKTIAPLELAEDWDNVGLLIEPTTPKQISRVILTIDLTDAVLQEAISNQVELIIAYHPPIFRPMKNLRNDNWKNLVALTCIEHGIAVYSPHTALDAVEGGINDWLLQCFECCATLPITVRKVLPKYTHHIKFEHVSSPQYQDALCRLLPNMDITFSSCQDGMISGDIFANESDINFLKTLEQKDYIKITSVTMKDNLITSSGIGRRAVLKNPIKISEAVERAKRFLNLKNIRLSLANNYTLDSLIHTVAVCAGSGAEVLRPSRADLLLTGEMSHHDLLDAAHNGSTVILAEHSNSERHYLEQLRKILMEKLPGVAVSCSNCDKDPVLIV